MNSLGAIGKFLYLIPMIGFGFFHLTNAETMKAAVPPFFPAPVVWVYMTGATFLLAVIAVFVNRKARLAMTLLGLQILGFALLVQLRAVMGGDEMAMGHLMKDLALAGSAFFLSSHLKN